MTHQYIPLDERKRVCDLVVGNWFRFNDGGPRYVVRDIRKGRIYYCFIKSSDTASGSWESVGQNSRQFIELIAKPAKVDKKPRIELEDDYSFRERKKLKSLPNYGKI